MSVHMSKPPKKTVVKRSFTLKAFRWRSAEERCEAKRKIDAIRREADAAHMELVRPVNTQALRNPKVLFGLLAALLFSGALVLNILLRAPAQHAVKTESVQGQINRARKNVQCLAIAATMFRLDTKMWPRLTDQHPYGLWDLRMDYHAPGWEGPYVKWISKDPWGQDYVYTPSEAHSPFIAPTIRSCGPDMKPFTADDIVTSEDDFRIPNNQTYKDFYNIYKDKGDWRSPAHTDTSAVKSPAEEISLAPSNPPEEINHE